MNNQDYTSDQYHYNKSSVFFGMETASFNPDANEYEIISRPNGSNQESITGNTEKMQMWVLQIQPDSRYNLESTVNSDACLVEAEKAELISLLFENVYRINHKIESLSINSVTLEVGNLFSSTSKFYVNTDEKNGKLFVMKK